MARERMSAAEFRALGAERPKNKFNARRTVGATGEAYDSAGEEARHAELLLKVRIGEIRELERQVRFPLTAGGTPVMLPAPGGGAARQAVYKADFVYVRSADGRRVVEDFKGVDTPLSQLKRAILAAETGDEVLLTGAAASRKRPGKRPPWVVNRR